jgi:palmitoyltransferase
MPRRSRDIPSNDAFTYLDAGKSDSERIAAFKARQEQDLLRATVNHRRKPFHERFQAPHAAPGGNDILKHDAETSAGEEAWRTSEGDRLDDFGVDEDVEFYDEENVPFQDGKSCRHSNPSVSQRLD